MSKCAFDGCKRVVLAKGLCTGHYYQRQRGEELRPLQKQHHGLSEYDRLMAWTAVGAPDACWNWKGSRGTKGWHGQWRSSAGKIELAHRAAWRLFKGEIPSGMFVLHRCDNPICMNPSHLFLGSQSDNARDMWAKRRANPGVSLGEKHGMSKLTADAIRQIRASRDSASTLADKYGVSATTIGDIRTRKTWKHIH